MEDKTEVFSEPSIVSRVSACWLAEGPAYVPRCVAGVKEREAGSLSATWVPGRPDNSAWEQGEDDLAPSRRVLQRRKEERTGSTTRPAHPFQKPPLSAHWARAPSSLPLCVDAVEASQPGLVHPDQFHGLAGGPSLPPGRAQECGRPELLGEVGHAIPHANTCSLLPRHSCHAALAELGFPCVVPPGAHHSTSLCCLRTGGA